MFKSVKQQYSTKKYNINIFAQLLYAYTKAVILLTILMYIYIHTYNVQCHTYTIFPVCVKLGIFFLHLIIYCDMFLMMGLTKKKITSNCVTFDLQRVAHTKDNAQNVKYKIKKKTALNLNAKEDHWRQQFLFKFFFLVSLILFSRNQKKFFYLNS